MSSHRYLTIVRIITLLSLLLSGLAAPVNVARAEAAAPADGPCGSDANLVACWPMEENGGTVLLDATANANNAAITGTPTWVTGKVGAYALKLSGTGQYAIAPDSSTLDIANAITLAAWVKPEKAATQNIIKKTLGTTTANGYELSLSSAQKVFVRFNGSSSYRIDSTTSYPITGATWMHIAATYDGANITLYVNGVAEGGTKPLTAIALNNTSVGIGAEPAATPANLFQGAMDDARVYNRALSVAEIRTLAGLPPPDTTPPAAPTGLAASPFSGGVILTWTANTEADLAGYNLYRGATPGGPYTKVNASLISGTSYTDGGLTNGVPLYYVLKAVDASTNESSASGEVAATPLQSLGAAVQFDGANDYVTFGNPTELGLQNFTVETWFKRTGAGVAVSTGSNGVTAVPLVTKGSPEADGSNVDENYVLGIRSTDSVLAGDFEIYSACGGRPAGDNNPIVGVTPIINNQWYHAAFTYDGNALRLYLNGQLEGTLVSACLPRYDSIQRAALATYLTSTGSSSGFFQGVLDETRIWDRALSLLEIQTNINSELTSGTGLVGRWGMNEGSGSTIADSTAPTTNGTLTNGPTWGPGSPFNATVTPIAPPAAPTNLLVAPTSNDQMYLQWQDNATDEDNFKVERSTDGGATFAPLATTAANIITFNDSSLTPSTHYCYRVYAQNGGGSSAYSNLACAPTPADPGYGLDFGPGSAYVTFGDPAALDLPQFTIETWFKRTGAGTPSTTGSDGIANAIPLVTHGAPETDDKNNKDENWILAIDDDTDTIAADFEDTATSGNHPVRGTTVIKNGVWYHAAATYDGATWKLYLNGGLEATLAVNQAPRSDTIQHAALGTMVKSDGVTTAGHFQGVLDEARVWNYARAQSEIQAAINDEITQAQSGLVARWGLNEGTGTAVQSSAGTTVDGVITNAGYAWVAGAPFDLRNQPPGQPALLAPADGATGVALSPTLTASVTDPELDAMTVRFYGRPAQSAPGPDFTLIAIPDPQYYASTYPSIYNAQMDWVVAEKAARNIVHVVSLGDNVDVASNMTQWGNATAAWDRLTTGGVQYTLGVGNHDGAPTDTANFTGQFGPRKTAQSSYGGRYGTSDYDNYYTFFEASGMKFIVVVIEYDDGMTSTGHPVLAWANSLLQTNSDRRAIVVTHNLLQGGSSSSFSTQGATVYEALKANPNLFLLLGGHLDVARRRTDTYNGNTVYSLRSDYQSVDSQQSGYLRIMQFSPADNKIYVSTYSPTQSKEYPNEVSENKFELAYAMQSQVPFQLIGSTTASSGANATVVWNGLSGETEYEWYAVADDGNKTATSATWSFTTKAANAAPIITEGDTAAVTMSEDGAPTAFSLTLNATDADADTLSWSVSTPAAHGAASATGTGLSQAVSYAPAANYNGADSFVVQVADGKGGTDSITVNVTVEPVNDAPTCAAVALATAEDTAGQVPADCADVDSALLTYTVTPASHGASGISASNLTYAPAANYNGPDSFTYKANDGALDSNAATVNVTVSPANDPPVLDPIDDETVDVGMKVTFAASASDIDGDTLTYSLIGAPDGATIDPNSGVFEWTPAANQTGSHPITVKAADAGSFDTESFTVTVEPLPQITSLALQQSTDKATWTDVGGALATGYTMPLDLTAAFHYLDVKSLTANKTLADGLHPFYLDETQVPAGFYAYWDAKGVNAGAGAGTWQAWMWQIINGQKPMFYLKVAGTAYALLDGLQKDYAGVDEFLRVSGDYPLGAYAFDGTITDLLGGQSGLTVDMTFTRLNHAPAAQGDGYATDEDVLLSVSAPGVLGNDTDTEADALTALLLTGPAHGALTLNANGSFTYAPAANYNGPDTFTYKANDGQADSAPATVTLTVNPVNDAPLAAADGYATNEDAALTVGAPGVLDNDSDADADPLTAKLASGPAHGALTLNADGSFTYTPDVGYNGIDSFTYRANDGQADSAAATVTVSVGPVNDPPAAVADSYATAEDAALNVAAPGVLDNDTDPENDGLTAALVTGPAHGALTLNPDGSFTYTPAANYNGPDSFTYKANDGALDSNVATVTLTVTPVNDAPVCQAVTLTAAEDATDEAAPNCADVDGDTLTVSVASQPAHGAAALSAGKLTYTPAANYNGADSFTYRVTDGTVNSAAAAVSVTVTPVNDAPALDPVGNKADAEGSQLTFTASATDIDLPADTLAYSLAGAVPGGAGINPASGAFTWTPNEAQGPGGYTFDVCVSDGSAADCETITVTVNEVNQAPVLSAIGSKSVNEGVALTFTATATDADLPANTLTYALAGAPGGATINPTSGEFSWTPTHAQLGASTFDVCVSDGGSPILSDCETITVTVNDVTPPTLTITGATADGAAMSGTLADGYVLPTANNPAVDHLIQFAAGTTASETLANSYFGLKLTASTVTPAQLEAYYDGRGVPEPYLSYLKDAANGDKPFVYIKGATVTLADAAKHDLAGVDVDMTVPDDFPLGTYTVEGQIADPTGNATAVKLILIVSGDRVAPETTIDGKPADPWGSSSATFTFSSNEPGATFECKLDGGSFAACASPVTYDNLAEGGHTFQTRATDAAGNVDPTPASYAWTVAYAPCGGDPTLVACYLLDEGSGGIAHDGGAGPTNDVTLNGGATWVAGVNGGAARFDGSTQYGSAADEASLDITNQLTIAAWIKPEQYATQDLIKKATNGTASTGVDGYELTLATTKSDDSSRRPFFRLNQAANGDTYRINAQTLYPIDGAWMHVAGTFDGATMRLYINGVQEATMSAAITIGANNLPLRIAGEGSGTRNFLGTLDDARVYARALNAAEIAALANRPPVAVNDSYSTSIDTPLAVAAPGVLGNDTDANSDTLTASKVSDPAHGAVTLNSDGSFTYTPAAGYTGPDSFTYKANDGAADSNVATVNLTVTQPNRAPVLDPIGARTVDEGSLLTFTATATDADAGDTLIFALDAGAPSGASIDPTTGVFTWTPAEADGPGSTNVTVRVTDSKAASDAETVAITVNEVNVAPSLGNPGNQTHTEGDAVALQLAATDSDLPANTLTYSATGLPPGLTINPATGLISGSITAGASTGSPYGAQVTVSDGAAYDAESFTWTVNKAVAMPTGLSCVNLDPVPLTAGTGEKPQSKVWQYDGAWWAVFPTSASGQNAAGTWLWKLQGVTWTRALNLSGATNVKADVKVAGNVVHALLYAGTGTQLVSVEYAAGTYKLWTARPAPANISLANSEIATIDIDSQARMWLATENDATDQIVAYYSDAPYATWNGPVTLATGVADDDISVVTRLPGLNKIGVLWSNQNTKRFGFKTHADGADPAAWSADEVPASQSAIDNVGLGMADDHMNVATTSDGTVYAAVKTSYDTAGYPKVALLVRRPAGTWDNLYPVDDTGTRGIVTVDEANGVLNLIYTSSEGFNNMVYRQSPLATITFSSRATLRAGAFNDASSMKNNYTAEQVLIYGSSSEVAGQICRPAGAVPQPPAVTIAKVGVDVKLAWQPVTKDVNNGDTTVTKYQVYRSLKPYFRPGDDTSLLPLEQVAGTEFTDWGMISQLDGHYYVVRAVNGVGPSADSNRAGQFGYGLVKGQ